MDFQTFLAKEGLDEEYIFGPAIIVNGYPMLVLANFTLHQCAIHMSVTTTIHFYLVSESYIIKDHFHTVPNTEGNIGTEQSDHTTLQILQ